MTFFDLSGKHALVTGATGPLQRALAVALAEAGADVSLTTATAERLSLAPALLGGSHHADHVLGSGPREERIQDASASGVQEKAGAEYGRECQGPPRPDERE